MNIHIFVFITCFVGLCCSRSATFCNRSGTSPDLERKVSFTEHLNFFERIPDRHIKEIRIPENGDFLKNAIKCIVVTDKTSDASSGDVIIMEGGIGEYFVVIRFESHRRDMSYEIEVYV